MIMSTKEIRSALKKELDEIGDAELMEYFGHWQNFRSSRITEDEWIGISDKEKEGILKGLQDLQEGKIVPHSKVIKEMRSKLHQCIDK